ncbi:MAG: hypothetical protein FJ015_04305 [Chloroflexi bacterium]|nr:hypothetical protein [Chloroflexota bacterium]
MTYFRVLDSAKRPMQRLGYLKHLMNRCAALETSNIETLGRDLAETATRQVRTFLTPELTKYARHRLTDGTYRTLREQVAAWERGEAKGQVFIEIQDVYLSDFQLPSRTGKLVSEDWRKYPYLGVHLGLIRAGTWSPFERGMALLRLTPKAELDAFREHNPAANPLYLSPGQRILLLYCLLENDGDVLKQLYTHLIERQSFSDRDAGDLLPGIFRAIGQQFWNRSLPIEERDKLERLRKIAESIEQWHGRSYSGGGAREEAIKVRVEPFADIGFLLKDDPYRYEYRLAPEGQAFFATLGPAADIGPFLDTTFFQTWATTFCPADARPASNGEMRAALVRAWNDLKSPLGYAPIVDIALLGGIYAFTDLEVYFEIATVRQFLRDWQKESPTTVRFGVDRMGNMAHVRLFDVPAQG